MLLFPQCSVDLNLILKCSFRVFKDVCRASSMHSVLFWEFIPRGTDKIINKMKIEKIKHTTGHEYGAETNSEERGWYMSGRATLRCHTGWPGRSLSEWHLKKDLKEWRERGFWEAETSTVGGRNSSCRREQEVSPGCLRSSKEGRMKNPPSGGSHGWGTSEQWVRDGLTRHKEAVGSYTEWGKKLRQGSGQEVWI